MEAISPQARPGTRDRAFSDTFAARPRTFHDKDSLRSGPGPSSSENRPSNVPKGLETMLKTTTETGDIGMFSIKPPRIHQSLTTPRRMGTGLNELAIQKARPPFLPYGVTVVDDRRQLPSYARDNSFEVLSMYDTGSQKSPSRTFDEPDYRSYSMTRTSHSSYTLSNHRSYTSLRSQHDGTGLLQRPRSPFAYPARLRRPSFRPSSPALTDGGAVDYSRRVEIDRAYGFVKNTTSPSSLYAQKRKTPLSPRHEANISSPSLLSQASPPRRSSSPLVPRQNGYQGYDWQRKNVTASGNTSPARSTLSLASTVNLYTTAPISSTATTPGKLHPPSPLYYDYTEDFEVEVPSQKQVTGPPPQFRIEKTIPEDRPISADGPSTEGKRNDSTSGDHHQWLNDHAPFEQSRERGPEPFSNGSEQQEPNDRPASSVRESNQGTDNDTSCADENKKIIRLSGLGFGAQELNCRVEEASGLPSLESFVVDVDRNGGRELEKDSMLHEPGDTFGSGQEPLSTRTSAWSIGSQFPQFPNPPGTREAPPPDQGEGTHSGQAQKDHHNFRRSLDSSRGIYEANPSLRTSRASQCLPPSGRARVRSTGLNSLDSGLADLAQLIDGTNKPQEHGQNQAYDRHLAKCPTVSKEISGRQAVSSLSERVDSRPPLVSSLSQQRGKELQMLVERQHVRRSNERTHRVNPSSLSIYDPKDVPNFSHQIPPKIMARSESPMLAPKPISPARQLKLKNSIPQIMKALPALPPEPSNRNATADHDNGRSGDLINMFLPPLTTTMGTIQLGIADSNDELTKVRSKLPAPHEDYADLFKPESSREDLYLDTVGMNVAKNPAQRMKLKVKGQAVSPSKPWTFKEGESQSKPGPCIETPLTLPDKSASVPKQPKFRLRVIRASDSTLGTVRVNRERENVDLQDGTYPPDPKDLFTPSPGTENIFRHFGKHLYPHSRKTSVSSNHQGAEHVLPGTSTSLPLDGSLSENEAVGRHSGAMPGNEARSVFSDDSSQARGYSSLRTRISNLRTRIAVPYTAKSGAQSYDDITWKDRHGIHILPPKANHSDSNLYENRKSSEIKPVRRFIERLHRQRLKAKMLSWINGARSVIARVRPKYPKAGKGNKPGENRVQANFGQLEKACMV